MKLSITQTLLGILIIIAACFMLAWMIFGTSPSETMQIAPEAGQEESVEAYPRYQTEYTIARYLSGGLIILGIIITVISARQAAKSKHQKALASVQFTAGALAASTAAFIAVRGYPLEFITPTQESSNLVGHMFINPGPLMAFMILITSLTVLFGLAVSAIGITQLVKSRKAIDT